MFRPFLRDLRASASPAKAAFFPRFFKTGKGQYGEGDVFIGVTVPQIRAVVKQYREMPLKDIETLLQDPIHECRLAGLLLLVSQFEKGDASTRENIVTFYLSHLDRVNNWDLVDASAPKILGAHLFEKKDISLLEKFARSEDLWTQRIAIVATYFFIQRKDLTPTIRISTILLRHPHDLIHKAVGWMLREAGKRDVTVLKKFLDKHAATMPRTMLRYAIEKMDERERKRYLSARVTSKKV